MAEARLDSWATFRPSSLSLSLSSYSLSYLKGRRTLFKKLSLLMSWRKVIWMTCSHLWFLFRGLSSPYANHCLFFFFCIVGLSDIQIHVQKLEVSFIIFSFPSSCFFSWFNVWLCVCQLLQEQGVSMCTSAEQEIVRDMKERHCCVALDYAAELAHGGACSAPAYYTLPDGQIVSLTTERFR